MLALDAVCCFPQRLADALHVSLLAGALKGPLAALKADDSSLQAQRLRMENIVILAELSGGACRCVLVFIFS